MGFSNGLVHIGWGEFQEAVIGFMVDPCCRLGFKQQTWGYQPVICVSFLKYSLGMILGIKPV